MLPSIFDALTKGSDPDRMKGALYILWSKGIGQAFRYVLLRTVADRDVAVYAIAGRPSVSLPLSSPSHFLIQRP
jgi:hypothetical protein